MEKLFDQSRYSSGCFSFEVPSGENTLDPTCELKNKKNVACEAENYELQKQIHYTREMQFACEEMEKRIHVLENKLQWANNEIHDLREQVGQLEFEKAKKENEQKKQSLFQQIYSPKHNTAKDRTAQFNVSTEQQTDLATTLESVPGEENATNDIGLKPCTAERSVFTCTQQPIDITETLVSAPDEENANDAVIAILPPNEPSADNIRDENTNLSPRPLPCCDKDKYKDLLRVMAKSLSGGDVLKLKKWASENFSVDPNLNAADILSRLDQNQTIDTLSELRSFFDSITKIDNVYRIDEFLQGNMERILIPPLLSRTVDDR